MMPNCNYYTRVASDIYTILIIMTKIRILELFSGIGGLHWALKETGIPFEIFGAVEINPIVLETYAFNFPEVNLLRRNIESLTPDEINSWNIDAIVMSPPCQPFCRTGNKQGSKDLRSSPLNHLLEILPKINFKYIFIENVHGFETSDAHEVLLQTLKECNFKWQEFTLNPLTFGIPNSRLRYYLIGKHVSLPWAFDINPEVIWSSLCDKIDVPCLKSLVKSQENRWMERRTKKLMNSSKQVTVSEEYTVSDKPNSWCVMDIFEPDHEISKEYFLPPDKVSKYLSAIDIVKPSSTGSCCFTKAYSHYLTGTGSILDTTIYSDVDQETSNPEAELTLSNLPKLRYFTPLEVSRLLCYPEEFQFHPNHTPKQCYRALGNSVNVYIVAIVMSLLFS